jgi:hypothetical protein
MGDEIDKLRKKVKKQFENTFEVDENSDIPVHERYVKEEDFKKIKKKKNRSNLE